MSEIERYLDELFGLLAGQGAAGRRALAEADDHLHAAAADARARGLTAAQAEHEAVARFGPPALIARHLRAAAGPGPLNRAVSTGWLLAGLATAALGVACLTAAGRAGWQSPAWLCRNFLSRSCYDIGGPSMADTLSAVIAAACGAALLLGRWLAIRHTPLAPAHRRVTLAAGLLLSLAAAGYGMTRQPTPLPGTARNLVLSLLPGPYATTGATIAAGATILIECLAAAATLARPRPPWHLPQ